MRTWIPFVLLASCLTVGCLSAAQVDARKASYTAENERRLTVARKDYLARNHLTEVAESSRGSVGVADENMGADGRSGTKLDVVARAPAQGLRDAEWLLRAPDDGKGSPGIVFASNVCLSGSSCGCGLTPSYFFATAPDGHAVVLRMSPRIIEHKVTQSGSCSTGCGTPPPPRPPTGYNLPPTDPAKVEIADVPYDMDQLIVRCQNEVPAP